MPLVVLSAVQLRSRDLDDRLRDTAIYAAGVPVAATAGLLAFYLAFRHPTQPWYYIGLLALIAVCADTTMALSARGRAARTMRAVGSLLILGAGLIPAWTSLQAPQTNMDAVAARLSTELREGDLIIVNPWYHAVSFARYFVTGAEVMTIPPMDDHTVHRYDLLKRQMQSADPMAPLRSRIEHVLQAGHQVWVVGDLGLPQPGATLPALPQPPMPRTGWNSSPYEVSWATQVGTLLRDHVESARAIDVAAGGLFESAKLLVFSGWHP